MNEDLQNSIRYLKIKDELEREIQPFVRDADIALRRLILKVVHRHKTALADIHPVQAVKPKDIKPFARALATLSMISYVKGIEVARRDILLLRLSSLQFSDKEAIEYLQRKIAITREQAKMLSGYFRERYFWLAYVSAIDHIEAVKNLLIKTLQEGKTYKDFYRMLTDERLAVDPIRQTFVKRPWYAETVYRTNVISAFNAARMRELQQNEFVECLEFHAALDERTCPVCGGLHRKRAHKEDLFWRHFMPPLHYNCRCTVIPTLTNCSRRFKIKDKKDYHDWLLNKLRIEDMNLLKTVKEFTEARLMPWEYDLFPGKVREKIESLLKMAQKFYDLPSLVEIENRIIETMPFEFKHDMIINKYFLPNRPPFNPTQEEIEEIFRYTTEADDSKRSTYRVVNDFIRKAYILKREGKHKEVIKEFEKLQEKHKRNILTLQNIFLKYRGNAERFKVLYRGMPRDNRIIKAKVGQILYLEGGFVSTSYSESVARMFSDGIVLVITRRITRRIHPGIELIEFSSHPHEEEVLLPYGFWNRLKVLRKEKRDGIWYIYVEEI